MKKKMKFSYAGMEFEVPSECLKTTDYWGKPLEAPYISIGRKEVASMSKAFVKKNFPNLLVWASSEVFANGNSVDVSVCNSDGSDLDLASNEWKTIAGFVNSLAGGKYNGWEDIYEYGPAGVTDNGTKLESYAKYVHIKNSAPHGSWPSAIKCIKGMVAGEYVFGAVSLEEACEIANKRFGYSESNIEKALKLI